MKKIIGTILTASFLLTAGTASAQMGMMNYSGQDSSGSVQVGQSPTIDAALQAIYSSQNITAQSQLDCAKVTDTQFGNLGDAVMGYGITEQQHTAMENMMGGEGSATLKQAHINIARSYLGCWAGYNSGPAMPMMAYFFGSSTPTTYGQADDYYGPGGMMGGHYDGSYWFGWVTIVLVWILLILGIVVLITWLKKNR